MPWMASAAMALSSVSVVVSSLLLRYFKKPLINDYARQQGYRTFQTNKSNDIIVHRGIDNIAVKRTKSRSILSSLISSRFSLMISGSMSAVKNVLADQKPKASIFFRDERSTRQTKDEEIELQITAL